MNSGNINSDNVVFALDIGTRSILGTVGIIKDKKFEILGESYIEHEERAMIDGQIHDVSLVASSVKKVKADLEKKLNVKLSKVSIAAAGRFLKTLEAKAELNIDNSKEIDKDTIRSLELTAVKKAEDLIKEKSEGRLYCVGYTVKNYYLNNYIISNLLLQKGDHIASEVIATFLPRYVVDSLYSVMKKVGLIVDSLTLEPIAAIEAIIPKKLRLLNLALVDIGAGTSDIAISSKDTITSFGMVSQAGDEVTEAIVQHYLVDFETAEKIKKQCSLDEIINYVDVLGFENTVNSKGVLKVIEPVVKKISEEIGNNIIKINANKSPNAVFLVGGGAHTPYIKEFLAEKLNIPINRIAIKDRDGIVECSKGNNNFGSEGVTVVGIALVSIKRLGNDFIDVMLNGNIISLFNSHNHKVLDVMLQAGLNPKILLGKNGKNIKFKLNNINRVAFGSLANNAVIKINGVESSVEDNVKEGDNIEINFAKNGNDAEPKVIDYIKKVYSVSFFINDIIENMSPLAIINGEKVELNNLIKQDDNVEIVYPDTLLDYINYYREQNKEQYVFYLDGRELTFDYEIKEGDRIYRLKKDEIAVSKDIENENINIDEDKTIHNQSLTKEDTSVNLKSITVIVNEKSIILNGKDKYVFVDIFNHVEFDLSSSKGSLALILNGNKAAFYDELKDGDVIEIKWN